MADPPGAVGRPLPRGSARRLAFGRGKYADDLRFPGLLHLAFVRSPHAHARILNIDPAPALAAVPNARVIAGAEIALVCTPWRGTMDHLPTMVSPPQHAVAVDRVVWQGEPVAAVVAASRAEAEDAAAEVLVEWEPLPVAAIRDRTLDENAALVHPALGSNLSFSTTIGAGEPDAALAEAAHVVEGRFSFARHTGVPLEMRTVIADYDPGEGRLTVHGSHQSPWHQQDTLSRHLGIPEHLVRVVAPDIGGGFGIKLHIYGDEIAVSAVSKMLGRPVKYVADRMESFVGDVQARDQGVTARLGVGEDGGIRALTVDAVTSLGAYGAYGRPPISEGMMTIMMAAGAYANEHYDARLRVVFQNKPPSGMYRAVGQPIACAVAEQLLDWAAHAAGIDPVELRRRNYWAEDSYPLKTPGGLAIKRLSPRRCLEKLVGMMGYDALRAEQAALRRSGVYRGIGVATFLEMTSVGPAYYGPSGARISTQDGATVRLEPSGTVRCVTSVIELGQGTHAALAQIVADLLGGGGRRCRRGGRRHLDDALWRRRLGLARADHRRRGGMARGRRVAAEHPRTRRLVPPGRSRRARPPRRRGLRQGNRGEADPPLRDRPHRPFPARHPAARRAARARRHPPLRSRRRPPSRWPTGCRAHRSKSTRRPAKSGCSITGWSRIAGGSLTRCWSRSRSGAASSRGSAGRCSRSAATTKRARC